MDYVIVGSGFTGAVLAERLALYRKRVVIIEKRDHIGGNSYSYKDEETGIECHKYGSHIFHTNYPTVWTYVHNFGSFNNYRHKAFSYYKGRLYPIPVNLETINKYYNACLVPKEARDFVGASTITDPKSFEEVAVAAVGWGLYKTFYEEYSVKQWGIHPSELSASVFSRLPVRYNYNSDYFEDLYQGIPIGGYGTLFENMLASDNIEVLLNTDFFDVRETLPKDIPIIYTGPVDQYFDYCYGRLQWRTATFTKAVFSTNDALGTAVINYPSLDDPFIRRHEFKHYTGLDEQDKTVVSNEVPGEAKEGDDLYYPVPALENAELYKKYYREQVRQFPNVIFCGRLGGYKYINMDEAIRQALDIFVRLKEGKL